jgi:hypothetical protein
VSNPSNQAFQPLSGTNHYTNELKAPPPLEASLASGLSFLMNPNDKSEGHRFFGVNT